MPLPFSTVSCTASFIVFPLPSRRALGTLPSMCYESFINEFFYLLKFKTLLTGHRKDNLRAIMNSVLFSFVLFDASPSAGQKRAKYLSAKSWKSIVSKMLSQECANRRNIFFLFRVFFLY